MKIPSWLCVLVLLAAVSAAGDDCDLWLLRTKAIPGADGCQKKCAAFGTGMATFMCPLECEKFCKIYSTAEYIAERLTYKYALLFSEKAVISKYPADAFAVYVAKKKALDSVKKQFKGASHNNEANAYRHFVWAGLCADEISVRRPRAF